MRNARISTRTATRLAWSLWVVCVALIALALFLQFMTHDVIINWPQERLGPGLAILTSVLSLSFPTVGALIISRLPTNPVGWLFSGVGLLYGVRRFTLAYADYALTANFTMPGGGVRCLVLDVGRVRGTDPSGCDPYASVPRRAATVSPLADRDVDCGLRSSVKSTGGRVHARTFEHSSLR